MRAPAVLTLAALLLAALSGCSGVPATPGGLPAPVRTIEHGPQGEASFASPGPFVIRYDDTELRLHPVTYCVSGGCADGFDDDPISVGSADELLVYTGLTGFRQLTATQLPDDVCTGRTIDSIVTDLGDGWWRVEPAGPATTYRLSLFAGGTGSGDAVADLRWHTTSDQPLPAPVAYLSVIADHDGEPDSYGVEFVILNMEKTPGAASATITVTEAGGAAHTFTAFRDTTCAGGGALRFTASDHEGRQAAALGDFPFSYRVELTIDGQTHVGSGTYPDDAAPNELGVLLAFDEPLR